MTAVYVNGPRMLEEYKKWKELYTLHKDQGLERPDIPPYLAECVMLICTRLANRYNFSGYSFKDDMTADAALECVKYFHCFNPEVSNNIFAYFTKIAFQAFVQRINKERKQVYIKGKMVQNVDPADLFDGSGPDVESNIDMFKMEYGIDTDVYERHLERKRKRRDVTLDDFEEGEAE